MMCACIYIYIRCVLACRSRPSGRCQLATAHRVVMAYRCRPSGRSRFATAHIYIYICGVNGMVKWMMDGLMDDGVVPKGAFPQGFVPDGAVPKGVLCRRVRSHQGSCPTVQPPSACAEKRQFFRSPKRTKCRPFF